MPNDNMTNPLPPNSLNPADLLAPASAPPAHKPNFIEKIGEDIKEGAIDIVKFVTNVPKLIKAWNALSPQVKTVAVQIFHDVVNVIKDVEDEVADVKNGQFVAAINLSPTTYAAVKQLLADAVAGEEGIAASLKVLGVDLPATTTAPAQPVEQDPGGVIATDGV